VDTRGTDDTKVQDMPSSIGTEIPLASSLGPESYLPRMRLYFMPTPVGVVRVRSPFVTA